MAISRKDFPSEEFDLPSGRNESAKHVGVLKNILFQKIYIIEEKTAVVFSADHIGTAGKFIKKAYDEVISQNDLSGEEFMDALNRCWNDFRNVNEPINYRKINVTFCSYREKTKNFAAASFSGSGQVKIAHVPGKGYFHFSGSGNDEVMKEFSSFWTELENADAEVKSAGQAACIVYKLFAQECFERHEYTPLHKGIGGFYEFVFFNNDAKRFEYVPTMKVLYWAFSTHDKPYFQLQFGSPNHQSENFAPFRIYEPQYSERGLLLNVYEDAGYTPNGHKAICRQYSIDNGKILRFGFDVPFSYPTASAKGHRVYNGYIAIDPVQGLGNESGWYEKLDKPSMDIQRLDETYFHYTVPDDLKEQAVFRVQDFLVQRYADQEERVLNQPENLHMRKKVEAAFQLGSEHIDTLVDTLEPGRIEQAIVLFSELKALVKDKLPRIEAKATRHLGICHEILRNDSDAEKYLNEAIELFTEQCNVYELNHCQNSLAILCKNKALRVKHGSEQQKAYLIQAGELFTKTAQSQEFFKMREELAYTRQGYAHYLSITGQFDVALSNIDYVIDVRKEEDDRLLLAKAYYQKACILFDQSDYEKTDKNPAYQAIKEAKKLARSIPHPELLRQIEASQVYQESIEAV